MHEHLLTVGPVIEPQQEVATGFHRLVLLQARLELVREFVANFQQ